MSNNIVNPHSIVQATQQMASTATNDGESPNFVASIPAFPGSQSYCTMVRFFGLLTADCLILVGLTMQLLQTDHAAPVGSPALLAFNNKPDAFSLCTNTSANGRLDVVFSPVTGHPHYILDDCQPVNIQVIT
jgi:hypothetical protein